MLGDLRVLAVVPARSGSKGLPNKNMLPLRGVSLIGRAGDCLAACPWVDARVISTDSPEYAAEAERHGLDAPFLRPPELASDTAGAAETIAHALAESEAAYGSRFDIVLIVEPTSPLRLPADLLAAAERLVETGGDSVVTVSRVPTKFHPAKVFVSGEGRLRFYEQRGADVVNRQELEQLYFRNGVCYALTRECVTERRRIVTGDTQVLLVEHETVNIDEPSEFALADVLVADVDSFDGDLGVQ